MKLCHVVSFDGTVTVTCSSFSPIDCPEDKDIPCPMVQDGSAICVSELQLCDGITDCPQGTDEQNCADGIIITLYKDKNKCLPYLFQPAQLRVKSVWSIVMVKQVPMKEE